MNISAKTTMVSAQASNVLEARARRVKSRMSVPWASAMAGLVAILWTIPTFGLLLSSFRPEIAIRQTGWWTWFSDPQLTLDNYHEVLFGSSTQLSTFVVNSFVIALPSVVIPTTLALLAAYAFAWMEFRGRDTLFIAVFSLQIVPLQVALIPLLSMYVDFGLAGSFWPVWLSHSIFALPFAVFLLHNFMSAIPRSLVESARIDGAGHLAVFGRVVLPLLAPAVAAFAIFQFLWVWNDLLVALTFAGGDPNVAPLTVRVAELAGSRGSEWHLLSAGGFVAMVVPLVVFFALQKYFVRGLLAGAVKG